MPKPSLSCFVIGPIGNELAAIGSPERVRYEMAVEIWEKIIQPACFGHDLSPIRADTVARPGEITEQVFSFIRDADLLVADVTGGNANVMYELGLRHTVNKRTIQIGEHGQLPFDISAIRTIQFTRTPAGLVDGRKKLEAAIASALRGEFDLVTATRIWQGASALETQPLATLGESNENPDELGTMELLAEMESAIPDLASLLNESTAISRRLGEIAESSTLEIQQSDANSGGFAGRLQVANRLASLMASTADELEEVASKFEKRTSVVGAGINCLVQSADENPSTLSDLRQFSLAVQGFSEVARSARSSQEVLAATFITIGKASRPMRAASRRISDATGRIVRGMMASENWTTALDDLYHRHGIEP